MKNRFETELPQGYEQIYHIDARKKKTGLIMNLVAFLPMLVMAVILVFTAEIKISVLWKGELEERLLAVLFLATAAVSLIAYMVLHELLHGAAYKALTRQKLTFGMSWSCAFCGVPNVYVYRKTALISLLAPFVVFGVVFLALTVTFAFLNQALYLLFGILLGVHVGGCAGDLFLTGLLLFKYRDKRLLLRDTGPEQWIYLPNENV